MFFEPLTFCRYFILCGEIWPFPRYPGFPCPVSRALKLRPVSRGGWGWKWRSWGRGSFASPVGRPRSPRPPSPLLCIPLLPGPAGSAFRRFPIPSVAPPLRRLAPCRGAAMMATGSGEDRAVNADGWARGEDGMLHKKYDPHAELRRRQYERRLEAHKERRTAEAAGRGATADRGFKSNSASSYEERRRLVAERYVLAASVGEKEYGSASLTRARDRHRSPTQRRPPPAARPTLATGRFRALLDAAGCCWMLPQKGQGAGGEDQEGEEGHASHGAGQGAQGGNGGSRGSRGRGLCFRRAPVKRCRRRRRRVNPAARDKLCELCAPASRPVERRPPARRR